MKLILFLFAALLLPVVTFASDFLGEQKKFKRVRTAIEEKENILIRKLKDKNMEIDNFHILITAYKSEGILDIYVKKKTETKYQYLISYPICAGSGTLGPKRKQGDGQIPEGFYYIDRFNPSSNYYLSLGINYPNQSDKLQSKYSNLGGDIFIHGNCVTIGCLPMTDDKIKEIYLLAIHARNNGQYKIPVYIFPFKMTGNKISDYTDSYNNTELISFWQNLKTGFDLFENNKEELHFFVDQKGYYSFN